MQRTKLTIGMAVHTDFNGVYFSVQALRMYHPQVMDRCELIVIDNAPESADGKMTADFLKTLGPMPVRYIPFTEAVGTSVPRDRIFREATGDAVLCMDSHVLIPAGGLEKLLNYYDRNPQSRDLLSGPMMYDNLETVSTHFSDVWRSEMWGIWDTDPRGIDPTSPPFEIPAMGLGLFTCRKDAWLGFNENFRGFGGEEFYIHEKFRQAGAKCLCLPFLCWGHRFGRPAGVPYPLTRWNKVRNYVIGHTELGLPLDRVREHFVDSGLMPVDEWDSLVADPTRLLPVNQAATSCGGCGQAAAPTNLTLDELFANAAKMPSDINEHAPILKQIAAKSESVVEFGMRPGVSTVALLAGQPKRFTTYAPHEDPILKVLKARQGAAEFQYRPGHSLTAEIEETDSLFLDTKHTAAHLQAELDRHASKVRKRIAIHDTQIFGETGEDGTPGLLHAVRPFLTQHPEWFISLHLTNNHGFTILSRAQEDRPESPIWLWPSPGSGPGTELKALIELFGIRPSPQCDCNAKAALMDEWGVEQCRARRDEIVGWLKEGQSRWGWMEILSAAAKAVASGVAFRLNPLDPIASLVDEAIRRAAQKEAVTDAA